MLAAQRSKEMVEGTKNYVSGLEVEQNSKGYRTGVEKPLFAARLLRRTGQYPETLHWIEKAWHNAVALRHAGYTSIYHPAFRFDESWRECMKEKVAMYRESGMVQDEKIAADVRVIERALHYDERMKAQNRPNP